MTVEITRELGHYVLSATQRLPSPRAAVFPFFADARNLEAITPPSLRFEIAEPDGLEMREGLLIDYRLRIRGIPVRWQTEIALWDPPERFVDRQRRGPYTSWVHDHRFREENGATVVDDRVEYRVPGGPIVHALLVAPDLRRIFRYRRSALAARFGPPDPADP